MRGAGLQLVASKQPAGFILFFFGGCSATGFAALPEAA
jgi:hypothetical protein